MSDFDDSTSRPPNFEETVLAVDVAYKSALGKLVSAGETLRAVAAMVDLLDDDELVNLPFLLSRQLEVIRLATNWVSHTSKNIRKLKEGSHGPN